MKFKITSKSLLVIISLLLTLNLQAQDAPPVTINVTTAGTLPTLIDSSKKLEITKLTVTGEINGTDLLYIREMGGSDVNGKSTSGKLSELDLSGAKFVAGGSSYFSSYITSLNRVSGYAFYNCKGLTSVTLPNNITSIDICAFASTGLTSITIPKSVTSINWAAFYQCKGLTSINIHSNITYIDFTAFNGCTNLKEFIVEANNTAYSSVEGVLFDKKCTKLIAYPNAKSTTYTIPGSVTSIGDYAFWSCSALTSITIPSSVTSIGNFAFYECKELTSAAIPGNVTSIGNYAFQSCYKLPSITIPNSVTSIGSYAFYSCIGSTSATIGSGVTSIGDYAFTDCTNLKEFTVSENNTAFSSVEGVLFNKDCTKLLVYPKSNSDIYTIPNSVTSIEKSAFYACSKLTSITIPNSVTSIGNGAFCLSGLTSIIIPNSVTSIGDQTFYLCYKLASVTIPNSVTSIGNYAFASTGLKSIYCKASTPPSITPNSFSGTGYSTCKLYVPKDASGLYLANADWSKFTNIIEEESLPSSISNTKDSNIQVYSLQNEIVVTGGNLGENISVYTEKGALVQSVRVTDDIVRINVSTNHIYLVKIANKTFKVAL